MPGEEQNKWNYFYLVYRDPGPAIIVTALALGALVGIVAIIADAIKSCP